jgi:hypothetical protein
MSQHNHPWGALLESYQLSRFSFVTPDVDQGLTLTPTGIIFLLGCLINIITGKMKRKI